MRKHMQTIYKHQDGLTPNAKRVLNFLGSNEDQAALDAKQENLQSEANSSGGKTYVSRAGTPTDETYEELKYPMNRGLYSRLGKRILGGAQ